MIILPEDIAKCVTRLRVPKDGVPETAVVDETQLLEMRLSRPLRKGEAFNRQNLLRRGSIWLRESVEMVAVACFSPHGADIEPGTRVNVTALVPLEDKQESVLLARDVVVVVVNSVVIYNPEGELRMVSVAAVGDTKELFRLASTRGCKFSAQLSDHPTPSDSAPVDVQRVRKLLESLPIVKRNEAATTPEIAPPPRLKANQP
jgi:hypothetical protein